MARINSLDDIEKIIVHWSESGYINDELGCDDNSDIEKQVNVLILDELIKSASELISGGYDKTSLSIKLKNGLQWCAESKFYITSSNNNTLLKLLNAGE